MARIMDFFGLPTGFATQPENRIPAGFLLKQNYPNPFNPSTSISFSLNNETPLRTTLIIYDILGQKIKTLLDQELSSGQYDKVWNGKNDRGKVVPSGIYIYRLQAGKLHSSKKMYLLR